MMVRSVSLIKRFCGTASLAALALAFHVQAIGACYPAAPVIKA